MWHCGAFNHAVGGHPGVGFKPHARDLVCLGAVSGSCLVIEVAAAAGEHRLLAGQLPTVVLVVWDGHSDQRAFAFHGQRHCAQCRSSAAPFHELCHDVFPVFANMVPSLEGPFGEPGRYSFDQFVSDVAGGCFTPDACDGFAFLFGCAGSRPLLPQPWTHRAGRPPLLLPRSLGLLCLGGSLKPCPTVFNHVKLRR